MSVPHLAQRLLGELGQGPVFVHSDPFRTARLVPASRDRRAFLASHATMLREIASDRTLVVPTFNYDFPKTRLFDVSADPAQLGPLPEHFRVADAEWRTRIPMFSVAGIGAEPLLEWGDNTDPFGDRSIFAWLVEKDGVVMYYGDTFHYNTLLHHAEHLAGRPLYRYDKVFGGSVRMVGGPVVPGSLRCHVRPLGMGLDYDWPRLLERAIASRVCRRLEAHPQILAASARALCELWVSDMLDDSLSLLDSETREWVRPKLDSLGRRFDIGDFEHEEPGPERSR